MEYTRLYSKYLNELLAVFPAISVEGLKGIGKTVTSTDAARTVFSLDKEPDLAIIRNDADALTASNRPVLVDEWQKFPAVWDRIRRLVDDGASPGSYILADSSLDKTLPIHSGAGRFVRMKMYPLSFEERGIERPTVSLNRLLLQPKPHSLKISGQSRIEIDGYIREIFMSGLPAIRKYANGKRRIALQTYIDYLIEHDFPSTGIRIKQPANLKRWLRGYAAAVGSDASYTDILNASTAGDGEKPAGGTTLAYREALQNLWLIEELQPWSYGENYFSRLKQTPKHYLADSAIAATMLNLDERMLMDKRETKLDTKYGNISGRLFESLVFQSMEAYACVNEAELSYFKLQNGDREVDFIIQKGSSIIAVEAKMTAGVAENDVRHLKWLKSRMGDQLLDAIVIYTGGIAYRRDDGIAVVPLALFGA